MSEITNERLLAEIIRSKEQGSMTNELANMLIDMTKRVVYKPMYRHFTYKEDMIADALLNLSKNALCFKPEVSSNPFAFFHSIIIGSFCSYLAREKKERVKG